MRKITMIVILVAGCLMNCIAQTETNDTGKVNMFEHTVGAQLNGLIRQVFNFSNGTNTTVVSPYLFNYNINLVNSGWGLRVGLGYNYNKNTSDDGVVSSNSDINDLQVRFGIEKRFVLPGKWTAGAGIDGIALLNDDKTVATTHSFDTIITTTKDYTKGYGGGVMGWLRYHFTKNISLGTEASLYYLTNKQKNTTDITTIIPNGFPPSRTTESKSSPTVSNANFTLPIAFYLAVTF